MVFFLPNQWVPGRHVRGEKKNRTKAEVLITLLVEAMEERSNTPDKNLKKFWGISRMANFEYLEEEEKAWALRRSR
jgi:hypothetical protein